MGKQPTYIAICRHGARLDSSDRQWRSTAEKPWDTPLTYGGWIQCQMLGSRISNEVRALSTERGDGQLPKKRKVIIHSSPYLRCLQTSIAISAGLQEPITSDKTYGRQKSYLSRTALVDEDDSDANSSASETETSGGRKCTIRVDSFLEEWRCASYFENTAKPQSSPDLAADAKKYLSTPPEEIKGSDLTPAVAEEEFYTVDWDEKSTAATDVPTFQKTGLRAMSIGSQALTKRPRHLSATSIYGSSLPSSSAIRGVLPWPYMAPTPNYSIAPQDKIPIGYVAHARTACAAIDLKWDSMDPSLDFGDGGPWDEDWGVMHRRVGNGLQKMLSHYQNSPESATDEQELLIVIVTHQATCNALIRVLTGAPALHDIGLSSLTLAVRNQEPSSASARKLSESAERLHKSSTHLRRGSIDFSFSEEFNMKIIASTEHLRGGSNPLGLNSPRLGKSPAFASRRMVGPESPEGFTIGEPVLWRSNSGREDMGARSLVSVVVSRPARSQSIRSANTDDISMAASPEGLWGSFVEKNDAGGLWGGNSAGKNQVLTEPSPSNPDKVPISTTSLLVAPKAGPDVPLRGLTNPHDPILWQQDRPKSPGKRRWTSSIHAP